VKLTRNKRFAYQVTRENVTEKSLKCKEERVMEVKKAAMAGTLESSDAQVTVEPGNGTVELSIESSVIHQFGKQIKATVLETLNRLDVKDAKVTVVDKGALDCTLKARVECAVYRSNDITENLPWGGVIK
jgi:citrate lyase subunit gamma (acyl carrier protein)